MIDVSAALAFIVMLPPPASRLPVQDTAHGKAVYVKWCAGCHGDTGAGDGPAASHMLPRPRDFTGAIYKIRTTASGQLPTDQDVLRSIDDGLPGTAMPAWKDRLSERERRDVVAYLKTFSAFFQDTSQHIVPLTFSKEPGGARSAEALPAAAMRAMCAAWMLPSAHTPLTIGSRSPISSCAISSTRRCSSNVHEATSVEWALTVIAEMPSVAATSRRCLRKLASSMARSLSNGSSTAGMTPWGMYVA